ncbi:MAG: succinylglutamate desuccinylase/aspartoacylase family protein [Bacteroidetes bacterium]|nr:succinylglutamate desuccinylase/aspartoacylase family protein [Bacteroidota bacterium]
MRDKFIVIRKTIFILLGMLVIIFAGKSFYDHRNFNEPVVTNEGVTEVKKLGDYFTGISGTINDCNIYVFEGEEEGSNMLVIGGTHPEEPAGRLAAYLFAENGKMKAGKLFLAITANRSASTGTKLGGAYPPDFSIKTSFGERKFRMGDRWSNPLDQWPDPEVYIHYPSGQNLAYVDTRNLNRTWPGRENGTLTEQTCYAFMELIKKEKIDVFIDLHEAELQYPVISTIVAHENGEELATFVSMMLTDMEGFRMGVEFSPKNLHGLSHREVGDYSDAVSLLFEAPEPFLDATRGTTSREQLLTGKDEFVVMAGKHGLLFEQIDENGWPIAKRVGRHTSAILMTMEIWSEDYPDRPLICEGVPRYEEVIENGVGYYLNDPKSALKNRIVLE